MIRTYKPEDILAVTKMHADSGLNPTCMPDLLNPNFVVRLVADEGGKPVQAGFVKLTGEAYVLVDHNHATPQERNSLLGDLIAHGLSRAAAYGLEDVSAWIPPELEKSFGGRLKDLGWNKSPWACYSALLR